jgi:hypothetical protein
VTAVLATLARLLRLLTRTPLSAALLLLAGLLSSALLAATTLPRARRSVLLLLTGVLLGIVGVRHSVLLEGLTRLVAPRNSTPTAE